LVFIETETCYVDQAGLGLVIFLFWPSSTEIKGIHHHAQWLGFSLKKFYLAFDFRFIRGFKTTDRVVPCALLPVISNDMVTVTGNCH
jgi:hypothetical protein